MQIFDCGIGGCIDVAADGELIYAVKGAFVDPCSAIYTQKYRDCPYGPGTLVILEHSGRVLGALPGLGSARQIEVSDGVAYITAREDGLFIVDVHDPANPRLLCRYDTVEMATGIAVCGRHAAVCSRCYGIELLEVSDPANPVFLSHIRAGEVQSVFIDDGILYAGAWNEQSIVVIDIHDALHPKELAVIPLQGRGDGMFVTGGILYTATGQHRRGMGSPTPGDPCYGAGNGMEIYDVHDPAHPRFLSRTELDGRLYFSSPDTWDVAVAYPHAYLINTFYGLLIYDISDPLRPVLAQQLTFHLESDSRIYTTLTGTDTARLRPPVLPFDPEKEKRAPVCGLAVIDGAAFLAGPWSDLYRVTGDISLHPPAPLRTGTIQSGFYDAGPPAVPGVFIRHTHAQTTACAWHEGRLYAACSNGGIRVYNRGGEYLGGLDIAAPVFDLQFSGGLLVCAQGAQGLGIYRLDGGRAARCGRYVHESLPVRETVVSADGRFALCTVGSQCLDIVDLTNPERPVLVLREVSGPGLLYGRQVTPAAAGQYFGCYWNNSKVQWFDLSGASPQKLKDVQYGLNFFNGLTGLDNGRAMAVCAGGLTVFDPQEEFRFDADRATIPQGGRVEGKPTVFYTVAGARRVIVTERMSGRVAVCDIDDLRRPKILKNFTLAGNPGYAAVDGGMAAIPAGRQGLAFLDLSRE